MKDKSQSAYKFDLTEIQRLRDDFSALSDDEKDDELFCSNEMEAYYALQLIRMKLIQSNIFSTPDWIQEVQERFKLVNETPSALLQLVEVAISYLGFELTPVTERPESNFALPPQQTEALKSLQEQWKSLDNISSSEFDWRTFENSIPNLVHLSSVHAFVSSVFAGRYPTPEIILSVAKSFELYFTAAGELSLEEVFFGQAKQRAGNFASRSIAELRYQIFHDTVGREKAIFGASKRKFSLSGLASNFLNNTHVDRDGNPRHYDVEAFLRGYRRWRETFEESEVDVEAKNG